MSLRLPFSTPRVLLLGVPLLALALIPACTAGQELAKQVGSDAGPSNTVVDNGSSSDGGMKRATCTGTPVACDGRFETDCSQSGCTWTPQTCTGVSTGCNPLSQTLCPYVPGCAWEQLFGVYQCVGMAAACDERTLTGNCDEVLGKSGCMLTGGCSGTPQSCSAYTEENCSMHEGCTLKF